MKITLYIMNSFAPDAVAWYLSEIYFTMTQ